MKNHETFRNKFLISTDKSKLNVTCIHNYLFNESYWSKNISLNVVQKSIEGSFCFGVYKNERNFIGEQVGFARVVTDHATFAYLADVFILEKYRGIGLAKNLIHNILHHPDLQGLRRWMLATKDAHALYTGFGFLTVDEPERLMVLKPFELYPKSNS